MPVTGLLHLFPDHLPLWKVHPQLQDFHPSADYWSVCLPDVLHGILPDMAVLFYIYRSEVPATTVKMKWYRFRIFCKFPWSHAQYSGLPYCTVAGSLWLDINHAYQWSSVLLQFLHFPILHLHRNTAPFPEQPDHSSHEVSLPDLCSHHSDGNNTDPDNLSSYFSETAHSFP